MLIRFSTAANSPFGDPSGWLTDPTVTGRITSYRPRCGIQPRVAADVLAGDITLSIRLWKRPRVKQGGRYRVGAPGEIEVDAIELVPFAAVTARDLQRAGEPDRETLRQRAAHAGPIDEDTLVYRIEFHAATPVTEPGGLRR